MLVDKKLIEDRRKLALHLREVSLLELIALGGALDELQELSQGLAPRWFQTVELNTNAEAGIALGHDSIQDETLHPNFSSGHPEPDFHLDPGRHRSSGFDERSAQAGVRQISPDRGG